ncbi:AAA domain-containing protein [Methanosarcina mazei]|nr:AAA domain-containing protein [Methanosarcina mazei]
MSPLSIAQYLDPRSTRFDVIIFDEASQVRPEDAVGALLRGKQAVIMGDSKQLPPTDFFDTVVDSHENDPEDYTPAGDMESVLNVCKRSFPVKTLRWHYRSRHESLIAISNQEFYDNRLYVYPSPMQKDESLGLKFVHLPDAAYDRGRSGANRIEARAVARSVFEHFQKYPGKSLGVGTFNIKQQEAILEEIEALQKANPGVDLNSGNDRDEHFFVKNLETIQGDERDVILLSIGYGFDSNRKLSLNFGPLNREGGERRLNVLITRAREKCVVFSNFTSRDSAPPVSDFLAENGCEVHRQIGCAGYRLDLAVPDPLHPGRYVLGIECDGADYHSSPVARDRDRLRQQVLEGLGWKIYRVWSTDWYLHPKECREKLLEAVKQAVKQAKLQAKSDPESEAININEPAAWLKTAKAYEINAGPAASHILPPEGGVSEESEVNTFGAVPLARQESSGRIFT